jgi:membrane protein YdbS with pleckstrin-like domain
VTSIADGVEHQLDRRWITLARRRRWVSLPVTALLTCGALLAFQRFGDQPPQVARWLWYLLAARVVYNIGKSWYWPTVQYRYKGWKLNDDGIQIRAGVLTRVVSSVPRSRVQHIDLSQGFWERSLGLATVTIHTAGRANASVPLDGVAREDASRIRDFLLPQAEEDAV